MNETESGRHPVSVGHLVMGIAFLGLVGIWALVQSGVVHNGDIRWNFEKFVVSADGKKVTRFSPKTKPEDPSVIAAVEAALPR